MLDDRTVLKEDHESRGRLVWTPESTRFAWTENVGREPRMSDAPTFDAQRSMMRVTLARAVHRPSS